MHPTLARTTRIVLAAVALSCGVTAFAGQELLDLDARFRAKLAKEKVRNAAQQRENEEQENAVQERTVDDGRCGSQSIGNVDTGGRPGAAPREEFVFAPNAINIVGRGGCR